MSNQDTQSWVKEHTWLPQGRQHPHSLTSLPCMLLVKGALHPQGIRPETWVPISFCWNLVPPIALAFLLRISETLDYPQTTVSFKLFFPNHQCLPHIFPLVSVNQHMENYACQRNDCQERHNIGSMLPALG